jgi:hypothetical protein
MPRPFAIALLIALNTLPLYGVIAWGWQSFDLIFLYWLENLIIGVFTLMRILIRPYNHAIQLIQPFFLAPFFALHYGMFCLVHGVFVFSLFGDGRFESSGLFSVLKNIMPMLQQNHLMWAAVSLLLLQLFNWLRDIQRYGLGSNSAKTLMVAPYRRIMVLHIAILASGFALGALEEPVLGLIILVAMKTAFDVYHWHKDEVDGVTSGHGGSETSQPILEEPILQEMYAQFEVPELDVNGETVRFDSFQDLKDSSQFRMLSGIMRAFGQGKEIGLIEKIIDMRIAEENGAKRLEDEAPRSPAGD